MIFSAHSSFKVTPTFIHTRNTYWVPTVLVLFKALFYGEKWIWTCIMWVVVVQLLSRVQLFVTPWTAAHQASLSFIISLSWLKLMSIEALMPSNHLVFCCPLVLWPSIFPSIRVFSNESALRIRWPKYWRFSFSIDPSNESSWLVDQIQMDCVCLVYGVLLFKLVILLGIKRENME